MAFLLSFLDQFKAPKPPESSQGAFSFVPDELACQIFTSFTPQDLAGRISQVCQRWHRIAFDEKLWDKFDVRQIFPSQKIEIFDVGFWKQFDLKAIGLDVDDIAPMDNRAVIPQLAGIFAKMKMHQLETEDGRGISILTLPKGLTIDRLMVVAALAKKKIDFHFEEETLKMLRESPVEKTCRIVITNGILSRSKKCSLYMQSDLLTLLSAGKPDGIEACTLAVATRIARKRRLFNDDPPTFTRCTESEETFAANVVVGNFSSRGIHVDICGPFLYLQVGVAAVWDLADS